MRRLILVAMIAGLLAPVGLHAQAVYAKDGMAILDFTEGMPAGTITSESKTAKYVDVEPSTASTIDNNTETGTINATLYQKLEIALHDMNNTKTIVNSGTLTMDWVTAFDGCREAKHNNSDSGWRLPTLWELKLMFVFKDALDDVITGEDLDGTAFDSSAEYWSATEYDDSYSWYVIFSIGYTDNYLKTTPTYRVRCVREIFP